MYHLARHILIIICILCIIHTPTESYSNLGTYTCVYNSHVLRYIARLKSPPVEYTHREYNYIMNL